MSSLLSALLAYGAWGTGDTVGAVVSRKLSSWSIIFWGFLLRLSLYTLLIPFFLHDLQGISLPIAGIAILVGLSSAVGYFTFYRSTAFANPTLVGAIAGSWGASSLLYSLVFLHEQPNAGQWIAIIIIFTGLLLGIINTSRSKRGNITFALMRNPGIIYAFITMMLWGVCGSFIKIPIAHIGWFWSTYALVVPFFIFAGYQVVVKKNIPENPVKKQIALFVGLYALLMVVAECSYNIGIKYSTISLFAPIGGSSTSLYTLLSLIIFRERLTTLQKFSVAITITGIVTLAFLSV